MSETILTRIEKRAHVMANVSLSPNARILYFLIDDKAGESGRMWWHWRKLAIALGVGRARFFEIVAELVAAGALTTSKEAGKTVYSVRKSGMVHSGKVESKVRKSGMERTSILSESEKESVTPSPSEQNPEPRCSCAGHGYAPSGEFCGCHRGAELERLYRAKRRRA